MYPNPVLDATLIALLLVTLMLLYILAAADLANVQDGRSLADEDPAFIDFLHP